jgi:hypothetical protein
MPAILAVAASAALESGFTLGPLAVDLADVDAAAFVEPGRFALFGDLVGFAAMVDSV